MNFPSFQRIAFFYILSLVELSMININFLKKCIPFLLLTSVLFNTSCTSTEKRKPANTETFTIALERARHLISYVNEKRSQHANQPRQNPRIKPLIESDIVSYIQNNPQSLSQSTEQLYNELNQLNQINDPTKHVRLLPPKGQFGYDELKFYSSHSYQLNNKTVTPHNLVSIWQEFIKKANKEIILNVYEFDLNEIANELILAVSRGVKVQVGIDSDVLNEKPHIKTLFDRLISGGVQAVAVNAVGINHQKMVAIDWSIPEKSQALFSSGNLTQSCLGPEGDLKDVTPRPKLSIPNANHVITMKSWLASNLVYHELTKTFSEDLKLRGASYPTTGSYQITGPGVNPETLEAYPEKSFVISFTPGGGYKSINKNIISHFIEKSDGPIRLVQFAYSSQDVSDALLKRAVRDLQTNGKFDFLSIGDTPFAMQDWSQFLKMSGLKRIRDDVKKISRFYEDNESPWKKSLSESQLKTLRSNVRVAPRIYNNSTVLVGGKRHPVSAKIHHKLMSAGDYAIIGTSFNFSEGAENNNEQILVFRDSQLAKIVEGIAHSLAKESPSSVFEEAMGRNSRLSQSTDIDDQGDSDKLVP